MRKKKKSKATQLKNKSNSFMTKVVKKFHENRVKFFIYGVVFLMINY